MTDIPVINVSVINNLLLVGGSSYDMSRFIGVAGDVIEAEGCFVGSIFLDTGQTLRIYLDTDKKLAELALFWVKTRVNTYLIDKK